MAKLFKTFDEWKQQLTPEQFEVTRRRGTERPFTGEYADCWTAGTYSCVCCGQDPEVSLEAIAAELVLMGRCAGRMTDSVFIRRSIGDGESVWEEYHPVYFGDGCWTSARLKGLHWRAE